MFYSISLYWLVSGRHICPNLNKIIIKIDIADIQMTKTVRGKIVNESNWIYSKKYIKYFFNSEIPVVHNLMFCTHNIDSYYYKSHLKYGRTSF